ncbi:unnamed protein product [Peronospora belbahrii]|uniref:XPA C-terminal domain-containing protein n=1 Tax=Peronospora belbahrii TaxID=622444 RepID=A0AAU9LBM2_9STRA|nr:unnamed protein product [Peronospora belbahrii]CAH0515846.1 unnamed protein product [Peronospora belbahrii]
MTSVEFPVGRCMECNMDAMYLDRILLEHFALRVCMTCKQDQTLHHGAFELVSKSRARVEYALPASCFEGLPCLRKRNPHHEAFAPLQLYLRRQLIQEADRLYGNKEGLEQEIQKRKKKAFQVAAKRTNHLLKRKHLLRGDQDIEQMIQEEKKKTKVQDVPLVADTEDHCHDFKTEKFHEETKTWTKTCECGMHVEFEQW